MNQMMSVREASPVLADGFRIHADKIRGNDFIRAIQPERAPSLSSLHTEISGNAVRKELERILDSPEFKNKPMLCGFLSHVVEETLAGRAHEIKGYTIATEVFGRRKDFDPTIDPIVRIQAGRLRRALESYYLGRGRQNHLRIDIGKGSYVPTFFRFVCEKPWMGEFHQPALMLLQEREISQDSPRLSRFPNEEGPTIAVMPIVNLTNDPDQEYIASGLSEELMDELARCQGLQVKASHIIMQWNGEGIGASQIGPKFAVRFVLEGSFRKVGQIIKFTFRLIDTGTMMQIWGEQYKRDHEPDKTIDLQEEIARGVVDRIGRVIETMTQKLSEESRNESQDTLYRR